MYTVTIGDDTFTLDPVTLQWSGVEGSKLGDLRFYFPPPKCFPPLPPEIDMVCQAAKKFGGTAKYPPLPPTPPDAVL